jgi:branched-chain amino acid transport system permease protein
MTDLLQALVEGLVVGGIYALIASGLMLILGVMKIVNFAQLDLTMVGMYASYFALRWFGLDPYLVAVPVALLMGLVGVVISLGLLERIPRGNQDAQLILTLGIGLVLQNLATGFIGPRSVSVNRPYSAELFEVSGIFINQAQLFACGASAVVLVLLHLWLTRTWTGKALRATADDPYPTSIVGINVKVAQSVAFGVGCGLAALAGVLIATFHSITPTVSQAFLIPIFLAVVLGGLGSLTGAVLGALIVGVIQSFSGLWLPLQLQDVGVFVLFVGVLLVRPQGLLGVRARV